MIFNNDALDDNPVNDGSMSFDGGMVSTAPPSHLKENEVDTLINMDITPHGDAITRRGTARLGADYVGASGSIHGAHFFDIGSTSYLVMANNGALWKYTGGAWSLLSAVYIAFGPSTIFAQGNNKMYFADGATNLYSWDGTGLVNMGNRTSGETYPPFSPGWVVWHGNRIAGRRDGVSP